MAIDKEVVQEALSRLNPENDNHWTTEGLPKIEAVKMFAFGAPVTREYLEEFFPDVVRNSVEMTAELHNEPVDVADELVAQAESVNLVAVLTELIEKAVNAPLANQHEVDELYRDLSACSAVLHRNMKKLERISADMPAPEVDSTPMIDRIKQMRDSVGDSVVPVEGTQYRYAVDQPKVKPALR